MKMMHKKSQYFTARVSGIERAKCTKVTKGESANQKAEKWASMKAKRKRFIFMPRWYEKALCAEAEKVEVRCCSAGNGQGRSITASEHELESSSHAVLVLSFPLDTPKQYAAKPTVSRESIASAIS